MTETTEGHVTWLTREAYERLRAELDQLTTVGRAEIARRLELARAEGDLRENGGYHATKEEQGKQESRIRQLTALLRDARVGEAPIAEEGVAGPGTVITVRFADGEEETFLLGSREEAAHRDIAVYSPQSPLGRALAGQRVGATVTYPLPSGREMSVELLQVSPYPG